MTPQDLETLSQIASGTISYLTAEQGQSLVSQGAIVVDGSDLDPSNPSAARVALTEAGQAALNQFKPPVTEPEVVIGDVQLDIAIPAPGKRGGGTRECKYPFDDLVEPYQDPNSGQMVYPSFHVKTEKNLPSTVTAANNRYKEPVFDANGAPVMITRKGRQLVTDAEGNAVLSAEGKKQFEEVDRTEQEMKATRKFICRKVSANDPNGEGWRVFRVPLDFAG